MAKNKMLKKYEEVDDFDFSEIEPSYDNEMIADLMGGLIEASKNQMLIAIELTKLAVEKNANNVNEDDVFAIFKKATGVIAESFPLQSLLDTLPMNE